ncbi:MAG: hypothetical protein GYA46_04050 [candidate division Zixibacteria bacterium]|nr:hypothetical protein [candidate division Zixibacteria bacterium]
MDLSGRFGEREMRPVVLQDNLAKTQAAERMNQIQKAHSEMELRQAAAALKEKAVQDMEKAQAGEKTDMVVIRKEQEQQERERRDPKDKKRQSSQDADETTEHLDLTA